jgi:YggT family protein
MFVIGNFLAAVASVLNMLLSAYMWIIVIRALISWVNPDPYNPIVQFLRAATDPLLYRVRRALPLNFGGIDFSPIIVIAGILFLQTFLVQSLFDLARTLH